MKMKSLKLKVSLLMQYDCFDTLIIFISDLVWNMIQYGSNYIVCTGYVYASVWQICILSTD